MKILIGIPARYASTRFPGKPLVKIAGKEMVLRVYEIAKEVAAQYPDGFVKVAVATEDQRIQDFCDNNNVECYITSENCQTGTDRVCELLEKIDGKPEFVINLQGDNPVCPPEFVKSLIDSYLNDNSVEVATPVVNLNWDTLEKFREMKKENPFSGTCCIVNAWNCKTIDAVVDQKEWEAVWFSKSIIPVIRKEEQLKKISPFFSPVLRHIGLYGYRTDVLKKISNVEDTLYSSSYTEGLEQLRFLAMGLKVKAVKINNQQIDALSGVDSPADFVRAEEYFRKIAAWKNGDVIADEDIANSLTKAVS